MGSMLECSYYTPAPGDQEWVLVNGTPASCTQLGLQDLFQDRPPIDLVVSGPNFGRNATTIYNLSSGTVGGALEAALCRKRAIAISFASKDGQAPEVIDAAARISVRLIEKLYCKWGAGVELYNINVPMIPSVETARILYTHALPSSWTPGRLYQELKDGGGNGGSLNGGVDGYINGHNIDDVKPNEHQDGPKNLVISRRKYFKWAPELSDIVRCIEESPRDTDAWAVEHGAIRYEKLTHQSALPNILPSVTPLKANFLHVPGFSGRLEL